jgi:two-component system response regulator
MSEQVPIEILLVEDDLGDVVMTREALADGKITNRLHVVGDGIEAMSFLHRSDAFVDAPRPDLILLDLVLPGRDGRQVLGEVKDDPDLCDIPVVVLTTSRMEADILHSYELRAEAYLVKPVAFDHFIDVIRQIEEFGLAVVRRS